MSRRTHFDFGHQKPEHSFSDVSDDDEGPYCANCSDDMGEFSEWNDRQDIHPSKRVPCKGCGAV